MRNLIKISTLIILFLPNIVLAITCAADDNMCKTRQLQLQAMQKAGVKPTEIPPAPGTITSDIKKKGDNQMLEPQPFKIPLPYSSQIKKTEDATDESENQDGTSKQQPQTKSNPVFNIFSPNTNTDNQDQQEFVFQPPKSPLQPQPPTQQSTGIRYQ